MRTIERLILVYNANSGRWAALVDSARKALDLNACTLCTITHGLAGEKDSWRECRSGLNVPVDSLHRDELSEEVARLTTGGLPCILAEAGGERWVLLDPRALASCAGSVEALDRELRSAAASAGLVFPD